MLKTSEERSLLVLENYIGGKFVSCRSYIDSYDPSTGEVYCKVPDSGKEEVDAAVAAAKEAFPKWSACSPEQRAKILHKLADLIEANLEEFAQAESKDQGKTITAARTVDIPRAAYNFRFFSTSMLHHTTDCSTMDHMGCLNYTVRCPVGVAGLISPWNLPLYLLTWKIAPAIAAGNTVVAKPSEMTSVTAWMLCKLMQQAGVPPGVVNIVFGSGPRAGDALVSHPEVPLISFTGSTATAQRITERSAPYCKKLSLELGGKNPAIIFADADLDQCIETTVRSSFLNQGEVCLCTSRIYVERIITGISDSSRVMQEEIFGPVTCISPFDTEDEAVARGNGVRYGLSATVWSKDVGKVHRVAQRLQAGLVWTNCWLVRDLNLPFGGMKNSGVGREGGKDSYHFFTEVKSITIKH
ncbi:2-aminomuconic semialdehyde dehydrogenase [Neolamprologus brichardi]|uniref:2-aminomuconic semialdehyde dehydrogenase n=1 Tax=Neolamprologus brichardi TaxID=32507 RepID=UPI001643D024|nr:2-aminomuconic semialdehyde dehydrogenase [Neolamprologus brichardi]